MELTSEELTSTALLGEELTKRRLIGLLEGKCSRQGTHMQRLTGDKGGIGMMSHLINNTISLWGFDSSVCLTFNGTGKRPILHAKDIGLLLSVGLQIVCLSVHVVSILLQGIQRPSHLGIGCLKELRSRLVNVPSCRSGKKLGLSGTCASVNTMIVISQPKSWKYLHKKSISDGCWTLNVPCVFSIFCSHTHQQIVREPRCVMVGLFATLKDASF